MQAYLTTSTASNSGKDFKLIIFLSSALYTELVTDNTNTSQPSINEPLVNVTAANSSRIVNCTNFIPLNQTEISVEVSCFVIITKFITYKLGNTLLYLIVLNF